MRVVLTGFLFLYAGMSGLEVVRLLSSSARFTHDALMVVAVLLPVALVALALGIFVARGHRVATITAAGLAGAAGVILGLPSALMALVGLPSALKALTASPSGLDVYIFYTGVLGLVLAGLHLGMAWLGWRLDQEAYRDWLATYDE